MASIFMRNDGKYRSCSTSSEVMMHAHRRVDRHVQLVDLALPLAVLELPHPLLADGVDVERFVGHAAHEREVHARAPDEHHHREDERDARPDQLERQRPVNRLADSRRASGGGT